MPTADSDVQGTFCGAIFEEFLERRLKSGRYSLKSPPLLQPVGGHSAAVVRHCDGATAWLRRGSTWIRHTADRDSLAVTVTVTVTV